MIGRAALLTLSLALSLAACDGSDAPQAATAGPATIPLSIVGARQRHAFRVEVADTVEEQRRGLMFRPALADDRGMLFAPYPPEGGAPKVASFWMKDTPSPLDIVFIRADHSIAAIAENTAPFSEAPVSSGEPVAAVLELRGGRAAELGIAEGDRVTW